MATAYKAILIRVSVPLYNTVARDVKAKDTSLNKWVLRAITERVERLAATEQAAA